MSQSHQPRQQQYLGGRQDDRSHPGQRPSSPSQFHGRSPHTSPGRRQGRSPHHSPTRQHVAGVDPGPNRDSQEKFKGHQSPSHLAGRSPQLSPHQSPHHNPHGIQKPDPNPERRHSYSRQDPSRDRLQNPAESSRNGRGKRFEFYLKKVMKVNFLEFFCREIHLKGCEGKVISRDYHKCC